MIPSAPADVSLIACHGLPVDIRAEALFLGCRGRLGELAARARAKGSSDRDALLLCIEVDSNWRSFAERLMPDQEPLWAAYRARRHLPLALGRAPRELVEPVLARAVPTLSRPLLERIPRGLFRAVVCVDGGASLYLVTPTQEPS